METSALKNSVRILDFARKNNEDYRQGLINELDSQANHIESIYITPFNEELSKNVLSTGQTSGIEILIKQYLREFSLASKFIELHKEIISSRNEIISDIFHFGTIKSFEKADLSSYHKYIVLAYTIYDTHLNYIFKICETYDLDFERLCQVSQIDSSLIDTEIDLVMREPEVRNINDKARTFPECLETDKQTEIAEMCKNIFTSGQSPKKYSIMFSLLTNRGLMTVPHRKRSPYYKAWYSFINIPIPKKDNFTAINKYLDTTVNGFRFGDEYDTDYLQLEDVFNRKLDSINL